MRHILIFTGTRADWGILSPVARALAARPDCRVTVAATNMHLSPRFGHTVDEIRADGFDPVTIPMDADADSDGARVAAMGSCMTGAAALIESLRPDIAVILGDRFEMLACASACAMMRLPVAHIAGGEISEGAIDDAIRHAITKLSSLHLTATEPYRRRVMELGEDPELVINTGALGVSNLRDLADPVSREDLEAFTGLTIDRSTAIVTYHPATLDDAPVDSRVSALTDALDETRRSLGLRFLFTYANNDARGSRVNELLRSYVASAPAGSAAIVPSLGRRRYHSALRLVGAVIGNSSSGLVEVPSAGIPTVDIGVRQRGRIAGPSVIHCDDSSVAIARAVARAFSPEMQALAARCDNPYYRPDSLARVVDAIALTPLDAMRLKRFHDVIPL